MRTLVTGGTGFVGSNIVSRFAALGNDVVAMDTTPPDGQLERFWKSEADRIRFIQADVTDGQLVGKILDDENIDSVVHAAAITSQTSPDSLSHLLRVNLVGSVSVLDAALEVPSVRRLVCISSGIVYGPSSEGQAIPEDFTLVPTGPYAVSKYMSETLARYAATGAQFQTAVLRLGWVYGPMERPTSSRSRMSTIWELCHHALAGQEIRINNVDATRDWVHSMDVAGATYAALRLPDLSHSVLNVSGGRGFTTQEVLQLLKEEIPGLRWLQTPEARANIIVNTRNRRGHLDIRQLLQTTEFTPTFDLRSGLRAYVKWLRDPKGEEWQQESHK